RARASREAEPDVCGPQEVPASHPRHVASPPLMLGKQEIPERGEAGKGEIRAGHARVQAEPSPIDPRDGQAERLAADHVRELRLPGMKNLFQADSGARDEIAEEAPVRLVAARLLGGADEVE